MGTDSSLNYSPLWKIYGKAKLNESSTHIFKVPLQSYDEIKQQYPYVLNSSEIAAASRFKYADDKKRYVLGKYTLRTILSDILNIRAEDVSFFFGDHKKPYTKGRHFNISHSGQFTCIAINQVPVGIDVELIRTDFDFKILLNECFTTEELRCISGARDFYHFWTRKEAVLKAGGEGLTDQLNVIDCSPPVVNIKDIDYNIETRYIDSEHVFSVATENGCKKKEYWSFNFK